MQSGTLLGERYTLGEQLGAGACGSVWTGHDTIVDRPVTIKILKPDLAEDDSPRERFRQVALKVAGLAIPGIVDVYDCLEEPDPDGGVLVCQITERVAGRSLREILTERGALPSPEALALLADAARALHAAHREGVVHGNLKPENLFVDDGTVGIVDFGFLPPRPSPYTAPELADDDPAVDVYGLGAVVYECLTGLPPAADGDISPLLNDMYPADAAPIMKALSPQANHRFASVIAFADACLHTDPAHHEHPDTNADAAATSLVLELDLATAAEAPTEQPSGEPVETDTDAEPAAEAAVVPPVPEPEATASGEAPDDPAADSPKVKATAAVASAAPDEADPDPDADTDPPEPTETPRRSRRPQALVIGLLIAVLTIAAAVMHFAVPGQPTGSPGGHGSSSESSESSTSESSSSATDVDRSPNSADPAPTSSSPTPSDSASPDGDQVQVPKVIGMRRESAESELSSAGLTVLVNGSGDGRWECRVDDQNPVGGKNVPAGSTVTISVRRVHSPQQCIDPTS